MQDNKKNEGLYGVVIDIIRSKGCTYTVAAPVHTGYPIDLTC